MRPEGRPTIPVPRPAAAEDALRRIPVVTKSMAELHELPLDPRAGFVLTHIDGRTDLTSLIDVTGMSAQETLAIVARLVNLGALELLRG